MASQNELNSRLTFSPPSVSEVLLKRSLFNSVMRLCFSFMATAPFPSSVSGTSLSSSSFSVSSTYFDRKTGAMFWTFWREHRRDYRFLVLVHRNWSISRRSQRGWLRVVFLERLFILIVPCLYPAVQMDSDEFSRAMFLFVIKQIYVIEPAWAWRKGWGWV